MCVQFAADYLRKEYIQSVFQFEPNEWPPYKPKYYTSLALICFKECHSESKVISVTQELAITGNITGPLKPNLSGNKSYLSKDISELFKPDFMSSVAPNFVLIEGAPGIGKTVLSKEIAFQWANHKLLKLKSLVFLLYLCDPNLKAIYSIQNLMHYLFKNNQIAADLSQHLFQTNGKGVTIILDGYDEMSEVDRNNCFVAKVINRVVLPQCGLVITSRPSASLNLRHIADCRVEVLGFTEKDRLDYIQHALQGSDDKIKALQLYLQSNLTINAFCYIPLNMTILLSLFQNITESSTTSKEIDTLPNTLTELYEKFITITIVRYIKKQNIQFSDPFNDVSNLPEPYNKIVVELSQLAFINLQEDKIVFDIHDIAQCCPNLTMTSSNWDGLGLLKATEFSNNVSFHFLHISIQEYLAAYYIASLSDNKQIQLLQSTFWNIRYYNTWIMYVGLTHGNKFAWKHFLSGNHFQISSRLITRFFKTSTVSKHILNDKIKRLHLFHCFLEAGGNESFDENFKGQIIDLSNQTLSPISVNTLAYFLLRSGNKHWKMLNLSKCTIGDVGCNLLFQKLKDVTVIFIDKVDLSHNDLQAQPILLSLKLLKVWHTSEAVINEINDDSSCDNNDHLFLNAFSELMDENFSLAVSINHFIFAYKANQQNIYSLLLNSSWINSLYLHGCKWQLEYHSSEKLQDLLKLIQTQIVCKLHVIENNLPKHIILLLVKAIEKINDVYICEHTLSDEDVDNIAGTLQSSANIWLLVGKNKILGNINTFTTLHKILSKSESLILLKSIRKICSNSNLPIAIYYDDIQKSPCDTAVITLLHKNASKYLINIHACHIENNILIGNNITYWNIFKTLSSHNHLVSVFISNCYLNEDQYEAFVDVFCKQESLLKFYLFDSYLKMQFIKLISDKLLNNQLLIQELFIHTNDPFCTISSDILQTFYPSIAVMFVTKNMIAGKQPTTRQISLSLQLEPNIAVWKFCKGKMDAEELYRICNILTSTATNVHELDVSGCNLGECEIEAFINCNKHCAINWTKLNFSRIKIDEIVAHKIASVLSRTTKLEELDLSYNNLQVSSAIRIFREMKNIHSLRKLDISHNLISDQAADDLAAVLFQNTKLKILDLSHNNFLTESTVKIFRMHNNISGLSLFNISHNNITEKGASNIAAFLTSNTKLKKINISHIKLQTTGAIKILNEIAITSLTKFNISHNNITAEAAHDIARFLLSNTEIEEIDLSYNDLKDSGTIKIFESLRNVTGLVKLNISHNNINSSAAKAIAAVLLNNSNLQELDLSGNDFQSDGATIIFRSMKNCLNLTKLNIKNININHETAAYEIAFVLFHNVNLKELDMSYNELAAGGMEEILKAMSKISHLEKLSLSGSSLMVEMTNKIASVVFHNPELKEIDLSYNNLQTKGTITVFKQLNRISNLTYLDFNCIEINNQTADYVAAVLSHNIRIETLNLNCSGLQAEGATKIFKAMRLVSNLKTLNIGQNMITDQAANDLAALLSHNHELKHLNLSNNKLQAQGAIKILNGLKDAWCLIYFNISNNNITDLAAEHLAVVLLKCTALVELNLSCTDMQTTGIIKIIQAMKKMACLKSINFGHNYIMDEAANYITNLVSHNTMLRKLDLSNNCLQSVGAISIFKGMKSIVNLKKLDISCIEISEKAAGYISVVLCQNGRLKEFYAKDTNLQATSAIKIFKGMNAIFNLRVLDISFNEITDKAADNIASVLSHNPKLEELNLSHNCFRTAGITKICKHLFSMKLITMNLSHNMITDEAVDHILNVIFSNTNLEQVDLSYNNLQTAGIMKISQVSDSLNIKVDVDHNNITEESSDDIMDFMF